MKRSDAFRKLTKDHPIYAKIIKRNRKYSKFNEEYEEIMEDDRMVVNEHIRNLTETDDIFGNLGRI